MCRMFRGYSLDVTQPAHPVLCYQTGCWGFLRSVLKYVTGVSMVPFGPFYHARCSGVKAVDSGFQGLDKRPGFCTVQKDRKDYAV